MKTLTMLFKKENILSITLNLPISLSFKAKSEGFFPLHRMNPSEKPCNTLGVQQMKNIINIESNILIT